VSQTVRSWLGAAVLLGVVAVPGSALAEDPEKTALQDRLRAVEDELALLRRQVETKAEGETRADDRSALVTADTSGFQIRSRDEKTYRLRLRGYVHSDGRFFTEEGDRSNSDSFSMRRVRLNVEGTLFEHVDFRIMPDWGGGSATLFDAWLNLRYWNVAQLQSGKYKAPFGLERLQSATALTFIERGLPTEVVPNRDVGLMLHGAVREGLFEYQLALMNGVSDGGSGDGDSNDGKDFVARVFAHPFKETTLAPLQGLGLGFALAAGDQDGASGTNYRTAGRNSFFRYASGTEEDGVRLRFSPQAYWYWGPFGLLFEWVRSSPELSRNGVDADPDITSWQVAASYVLTGEARTFRGVTPASPFKPDGSGWGAWEVAARYGQLEIDDEVFERGFADPDSQAREAAAWTVGLNWYVNPFVKLSLNFDRTSFDDGAPGGDRETESAVLTRFQLAY
jgi:phosphate-selective porin OprO and OprP